MLKHCDHRKTKGGWKIDMAKSSIHRTNNLRAIDLNLLVILEALLTERSVSRTAVRLNMSQPAVSHALGRLRGLFDDQLLVRKGNQLVPTLKAYAVIPPLNEALAQIRVTLGARGFDPAHSQHRFRIAMSDYGTVLGLGSLITQIRNVAPNIDLTVSHLSREQAVARVIGGEIDFALGVFPVIPPSIQVLPIIEDDYACLIDANTCSNESGLSLHEYVSRPHILVALDGDSPSEIDEILREKGLSRRVVFVIPHWSHAPDFILGSDMILTVARGSLNSAMANPGFRIFPPPVDLFTIPFVGISHCRRQNDPSLLWLKEMITACFREKS